MRSRSASDTAWACLPHISPGTNRIPSFHVVLSAGRLRPCCHRRRVGFADRLGQLSVGPPADDGRAEQAARIVGMSPHQVRERFGGRRGTIASGLPPAAAPTTTRRAPSAECASEGRVSLPSCGGQDLRESDDRSAAVQDHLLASVSPVELRVSPQHPPRQAHRPSGERGLQSVQIG